MATRTLGINAAGNIINKPKSILWTLMELMNDAVALANEMRTDHATTKVTVDLLELLAEELAADHATQKTLDDELIVDHATFKVTVDLLELLAEELAADHATQKTLNDELIVDHAAFKVTVDLLELLAEELAADHATQKTLDDELIVDHAVIVAWDAEVDADHDVMNNVLDCWNQDGVIGGSFTIATTAAVTLLGAGFVHYRIGGQEYYSDLDTTIDLQDRGDIVQNKYGAWRILIDRLGVVSTQDTGALMAFDNAEDALLNLSAAAQTANTALIGLFTVTDSGAPGFQIGTTNTTGGTATGVVYHVRGPQKRVAGLTAALGAASAVGTTPENYSTGTRDYMVNGLRVAQDAAEADKAFDDLDTIGQAQFGGWLIVTNLAQNATYSLAANGIAGSVSAMTYATAALAITAVGLVEDRLPPMFCPVSRLIIQNNIAGTWTAGTDDLSGTDGTPTFTDCTVGTWDRTATTGLNSHKVTPPTVPASITAPLIATLTATAPATLSATTAITSGPATLTATAPATLSATTAITSGPATLTATAPATLSATTAITSGPATLSAAAVDDISTRELGAP